MKLFICQHCGNIAELIKDSSINPFCCGDKMTLLIPKEQDEGQEKHLPVVKIENSTVSIEVGSVAHPMLPNHYIAFIFLETDKAMYRVNLSSDDKPKCRFRINDDEKIMAVYSYCNIHGLWKTTI
ncbi:MAG: desulfoferrodoxin family protein [Erysipelotrichaceae bacterium]